MIENMEYFDRSDNPEVRENIIKSQNQLKEWVDEYVPVKKIKEHFLNASFKNFDSVNATLNYLILCCLFGTSKEFPRAQYRNIAINSKNISEDIYKLLSKKFSQSKADENDLNESPADDANSPLYEICNRTLNLAEQSANELELLRDILTLLEELRENSGPGFRSARNGMQSSYKTQNQQDTFYDVSPEQQKFLVKLQEENQQLKKELAEIKESDKDIPALMDQINEWKNKYAVTLYNFKSYKDMMLKVIADNNAKVKKYKEENEELNRKLHPFRKKNKDNKEG